MTTEPADRILEAIRKITAGRDDEDPSPDVILELCNECMELVEQSNLDEEERDTRVDELTSHKCYALIRLGRLDEAERIATACLHPEAPGPGDPALALVLLADIALRRGEWESLVTLAEQSLEWLVDSPDDYLGMLARYCQALKWFPGRYEEGVELARHGKALAGATRSSTEEAHFSLDLAQFLLFLCRYSEAKTAAEEALALSQQDFAVPPELYARWILGKCCLGLGDPDAARSHAMLAIERVRELKAAPRQMPFLANLAEVALFENNAGEAMAAWLEAVALVASMPDPSLWLDLTRKIKEMVLARRDAAMAIEALAVIIDSTFDAHPLVARHALRPTIDTMKDWYDAFGHVRGGAIMNGTLRKAAGERGTSAGAGSISYRLLLDFADSLALLSKGRSDEALALAGELDRISSDRLRLRSSLDALRPRKPSWFSLRRWFSSLGNPL